MHTYYEDSVRFPKLASHQCLQQGKIDHVFRETMMWKWLKSPTLLGHWDF